MIPLAYYCEKCNKKIEITDCYIDIIMGLSEQSKIVVTKCRKHNNIILYDDLEKVEMERLNKLRNLKIKLLKNKFLDNLYLKDLN